MRFAALPLILLVGACGVDHADVTDDSDATSSDEGALTTSLALSPSALSLEPGGRATATLTTTSAGTWGLSLSALPSGVSASLSSAKLVKGQPVTLSIAAATDRLEALHAFTVTATSGSTTKTLTTSVAVLAPVVTSGPHVFVIAMENKSSTSIYGNSNAPYLNSLKAQYGSAANYQDCLSSAVPSEPHYVWLEAGTNAFADHTFTGDGNATTTNSTADTNHLVTQLAAAGRSWRSYQEGMTAGTCPLKSITSTFYAAKHDPFVFFQDVVGSPASTSSPLCVAHHRPYSAFAADLSASDVANYTFLTPNLCNDMHGATGCSNACTSGSTAACVKAGDAWLKANVPPIISFINANGGVLLIVFDEPDSTGTQPFFIVGPTIKPGFSSAVTYTHSSYLKTLERLMGVPVNTRVAAANDFGAFFQPGTFP
jgi:phosphatidylinositol-3-phosphatase